MSFWKVSEVYLDPKFRGSLVTLLGVLILKGTLPEEGLCTIGSVLESLYHGVCSRLTDLRIGNSGSRNSELNCKSLVQDSKIVDQKANGVLIDPV